MMGGVSLLLYVIHYSAANTIKIKHSLSIFSHFPFLFLFKKIILQWFGISPFLYTAFFMSFNQVLVQLKVCHSWRHLCTKESGILLDWLIAMMSTFHFDQNIQRTDWPLHIDPCHPSWHPLKQSPVVGSQVLFSAHFPHLWSQSVPKYP